MIVGWQLAGHMRSDLALDALKMALGQRGAGADVEFVHHSDRGSQYTSIDYTQTLIRDRVWRSRSQLELAVVEYIGWYNNARLHESLGDIPPLEYEQRRALDGHVRLEGLRA